MRKFEKGSEWHKWDLHTHTKGTNKNDLFKSVDHNSFCVAMFKQAIDKGINAIGITDYFEIENFKNVNNFVENIDSCTELTEKEKEQVRNIFILPNIELRMMPATGSGTLINIHCLFDPDPHFLEKLDNDFFGSLEDSAGNKMNRSGFIALGKSSDSSLTDIEAHKKGIGEFHLEPSKLITLFKEKPHLKERTIVTVSNSNNDGASALQEHYKLFENEPGSLGGVRRNIYQMSDAIFSGNPMDRQYFLGEKVGVDEDAVINNCGSLKPCIHGSDAHSEEKMFAPDKDRYCWIKADLTFEGLRQIICEPKDRVQIQANKPEEKSGYHVIESVEVRNEICSQKILFNANLNAIIGGRSTGKSTLLQLVANRIDPKIPDIGEYVKNVPQESIDVVWQDGEENKGRDIEYFSQNHMHEIARDPIRKNKLIQEIVEEKDSNNLIADYEKFCSRTKSDLQANIDDLFNLQNNIDELNATLKEKGDKSGLEKEIATLKDKVIESSKGKSYTEQEISNYEGLKNKILEYEKNVEDYKGDKAQIIVLNLENIFDSSFEYKFNQLSELSAEKIKNIYDAVVKEANKEWQAKLSEEIINIDARIKHCDSEIAAIKGSSDYIKGHANLEKNKQYKELNDRLTEELRKLAEINSVQSHLDKVHTQKDILFLETINNHVSYKTKIDELASNYSLVHDDIEIKIDREYRDAKCVGLLKDFVNQQGAKRQEFVNGWGEAYTSDIENKVKVFLSDALENKIELKTHKEAKDLAKGVLIENWFSISYELTYQNDTFVRMSDGKKAFVILKLLLEFSSKKCPILLDQPEDSLDNRAIYNELVTYLKMKKQERQIILVTHNANIVVNADAEEVIVANQHGDDSKNKDDIKFQYISGSLENTITKDASIDIVLNSQGVREHVCEILEGGTEAFKKREHKYAIA